MLALLLALFLQPSDKHWVPLTNLPGWEGYGTILPSGWIDPEKFRRVGDHSVEVPSAGTQTLPGYRPASGTKSATENPGIREIPRADPYGFVGWLNNLRGRYGLPVVGYDSSLSSWAATNNAQQVAYGKLGHFVMGTARRQNAGMGDAASVWTGWVNSPAHAAALFDPSIRWVGIAFTGVYWTYSAY